MLLFGGVMRSPLLIAAIICLLGPAAGLDAQAPAPGPSPAPPDPIKVLVGRLDLEKYKATVKGLTQFGDRRQGTDRNRAAVDWIEAQLKSYGCTNTERIKYEYMGRQVGAPRGPSAAEAPRGAAGGG